VATHVPCRSSWARASRHSSWAMASRSSGGEAGTLVTSRNRPVFPVQSSAVRRLISDHAEQVALIALGLALLVVAVIVHGAVGAVLAGSGALIAVLGIVFARLEGRLKVGPGGLDVNLAATKLKREVQRVGKADADAISVAVVSAVLDAVATQDKHNPLNARRLLNRVSAEMGKYNCDNCGAEYVARMNEDPPEACGRCGAKGSWRRTGTIRMA
jgi:hypothetical protein